MGTVEIIALVVACIVGLIFWEAILVFMVYILRFVFSPLTFFAKQIKTAFTKPVYKKKGPYRNPNDPPHIDDFIRDREK